MTPEGSAGDGVGIAVGGAKGEGVGIGCGEGVKEDVGGGGTGVAVGCGAREGVSVGCGEGVRVGVGGGVGLGDGCTAVGVGAGGPAAQLATRQAIPMAATSTIRPWHFLNFIQRSECLAFIVHLFREWLVLITA